MFLFLFVCFCCFVFWLFFLWVLVCLVFLGFCIYFFFFLVSNGHISFHPFRIKLKKKAGLAAMAASFTDCR